MNTASQIAQYILALSNPEIGEITSNLKLQKLLYYVQGVHLAAFDAPLFDEEILAWNYGPVVENVYYDYKIYGSQAIPISYNTDERLLTKKKKELIESTYTYFGQYSASKLMQMTHEETPWKSTRQSSIISKDKIKSYFKMQAFVSEIANISREQRLKNAALLLLSDYESDKELTALTLIDPDDFYETK